MKLKAETIVQTLVAMLVFMTALLLTFALFARMNVDDDDPFALAQAEEQVRNVISDFESGKRDAGFSDEYDWGSVTVCSAPYRDYEDLVQINVIARIPSSRKEIRRTILIEAEHGRKE